MVNSNLTLSLPGKWGDIVLDEINWNLKISNLLQQKQQSYQMRHTAYVSKLNKEFSSTVTITCNTIISCHLVEQHTIGTFVAAMNNIIKYQIWAHNNNYQYCWYFVCIGSSTGGLILLSIIDELNMQFQMASLKYTSDYVHCPSDCSFVQCNVLAIHMWLQKQFSSNGRVLNKEQLHTALYSYMYSSLLRAHGSFMRNKLHNLWCT